jgi:ATP-binding cassette subfamily F protein 3
MVWRGKVEPFDGDLDDYQRYLLDESKRLREEAKTAASKPAQPPAQAVAVSKAPHAATYDAPAPMAPLAPQAPAPVAAEPQVFRSPEQRKQDAQRRIEMAAQTRPFKKSLEQTEQRMAQLQKSKADLENRLASPMATPDIVKASKELGSTNAELDTLESKWLELSEQIQLIENDSATA